MQTIRIIFFLVKTQIINAFKSKANRTTSIVYFLFLIYLFFLGWNIPVYLNTLNQVGLSISPNDFLKGIATCTLSFTIFKEFIPAYIPKKRVLPEYHPLNDAKNALLSSIFSLQTKGNMAVQCLAIPIALADPEIAFPHFLFIELSFLTGFFISGNLKTLLEYKFPKRWLYLLVNTAAYPLSLMSIWIFHQESLYTMLLFFSLAGMFLLYVYYEMERKVEQKTAVNTQWRKARKIINSSTILAIILKTKKLAQMLTAGVILKLSVLLFIMYVEYVFEEDRWVGEYFAVSIFLSPLMTFVFLNNVYGMNRNLWLNVELAGGSVKDHTSLFKKIFIYFIALDALITIPAIVIGRFQLLETIIFYLSTCIAFLFLSFLFSCYRPKKINKVFFNLKGPASFIAQIFSLGLPLAFMLPIISHWFYLTNLLLIALLWLLYKLMQKEEFFDRSKQLLFIKLFKK